MAALLTGWMNEISRDSESDGIIIPLSRLAWSVHNCDRFKRVLNFAELHKGDFRFGDLHFLHIYSEAYGTGFRLFGWTFRWIIQSLNFSDF